MKTLKSNNRFDRFIQLLPIVILGLLVFFEEQGNLNLCNSCVGISDFFGKGLSLSIYLVMSFVIYLAIYGIAELVAVWRGRVSRINAISFIFLFIAVILTLDIEIYTF